MECRVFSLGVVGTGFLGRIHAEKISKLPGARLAGIVERDAQRAAEVAGLVNTRPFADFRELIGNADGVVIATPTESHAQIALELLKNGVNVLVEKPMTMNVSEADSLIEAARASGAVLQVGHLERFNGAYAEARGLIKKPVYLECRRTSPFPNRSTDVDVVLDVMIHDLDLILDIVGSDIESVEATGLKVMTDKTDLCNARLRFKNGCVASVTANRAAREKVRFLEVFEPGRSFAIDFLNQRLAVSDSRIGEPFGSMESREIAVEKKDSIFEELKSFVSSCLNKTQPAVTGLDGKRALEAAGLIQEALRR